MAIATCLIFPLLGLKLLLWLHHGYTKHIGIGNEIHTLKHPCFGLRHYAVAKAEEVAMVYSVGDLFMPTLLEVKSPRAITNV